MRLKASAIAALLASIQTLPAHAESSIKDTDFNNFTYSCISRGHSSYSDRSATRKGNDSARSAHTHTEDTY